MVLQLSLSSFYHNLSSSPLFAALATSTPLIASRFRHIQPHLHPLASLGGMPSASPSGSESPGLRKEQRRDWSKLDYLLKAAPPGPLRLAGELLYPVSTKCRPLCLVPPPALQPRRIYLVQDLEALKFEHYRTLMAHREATLGLDLSASVDADQTGSNISTWLAHMEGSFDQECYDQRDCELRLALAEPLRFIAWRLAGELGFTKENGEYFSNRGEEVVQQEFSYI